MGTWAEHARFDKRSKLLTALYMFFLRSKGGIAKSYVDILLVCSHPEHAIMRVITLRKINKE
jgi:hypothetical protein